MESFQNSSDSDSDQRRTPLPPGDWTFKSGAQVFGPVPAPRLLELLYRGEINGLTLVAPEGGPYRPLEQVPAFVVHVKKAEAALRVEREVTGARMLQRRKSRNSTVVATVVGALVLAGASWGAYWLATVKPWQKRSALLEDFGDGIALASEARVGSGNHGDEEVDVPVAPGEVPQPGQPKPSHPQRHPTRNHPTPSGTASGDEMVMVQYDPRDIQAVVGREQRTLAPCFVAETRRSPDFSGVIPLEFAVGNEGRVVQLWIDEPRFKHGDLYDCLLKTLHNWKFRPFPGQRPTVSLPFRIGPR
jgi:hypothetical protein